MVKRVSHLLMLAVSSTLVLAGVADDGFLTPGEYVGSVTWRSYDPPLTVRGGGALQIAVRDNGRLIVESTSTPLDMLGGTGVYDILLFNGSLLYLDGVTELIITNDDSVADLKGGSINYIKSMQYTTMTGDDPHINLYCLPGYSWLSNNPMLGVQGHWWDGSPFRIQFINDFDYDPVWTNINFIIPEPATLFLFAFGGLCFAKRKSMIQ